MRSVRTISRKDSKKEKLGFFLAGFVEGEGSFNISLRKKPDYKVNWQVVLSFNVSQKDPTILFLLKEELDCGIIKTRKRDGLFSYDVTNPSDINQKVIPYFQKFSMISKSKKENFRIFSKVAKLMALGRHRDESGLRKILKLRELINKGEGRTRKYNIQDIFPN